MKIANLIIAISLLFVVVGGAKAPPLSDSQKLVREALPLDRSLEYQGSFQISGEYSIQFDTCVSLKIEADEDIMLGQDTYEFTENGQLVKQKSYAIFNLCRNGNCKSYMASLSNYMNALIPASAGGDNEDFCYACNAYCGDDSGGNQDGDEDANGDENGDQDANGDKDGDQDGNGDGDQGGNQDEGAGDEDGGDRRRANEIVYLDCGNCEEHGCYDDNDAQQQEDGDYTLEEIEEWATAIAGCMYMGQKWSGYDLYAGFMCNADGSGAEIAIFLDNECSVYTNLKSFLSIAEETGTNEIIYKAYWPIVYPFEESISCAVPVYYPPSGSGYEYQGDGGNDEVSPLCESLFEEGSYYPLDTCGIQDYEAGDPVTFQELEQTQGGYSFYSYILTYEDSQNDQTVCQTIQALDGDYCQAQNYKKKWSGEFFDYKKKNRASCLTAAIGKGVAEFFKVIGVCLAAAALLGGAQKVAKSYQLRKQRRSQALIPPSSAGTMS
ncbi:expressed unknown protein [Seminavis robusta]|uniref:Uncharacterized protein n=1 Tax=Seminavis robusta TaxID=568900 RepID=A0A9N8F0C5_9STRA|nr:expressed unknown protein [Seminavis robusta]|eukprot:Sro2393_g325830.1 n/a (494) ;mRNA; f:3584-5065